MPALCGWGEGKRGVAREGEGAVVSYLGLGTELGECMPGRYLKLGVCGLIDTGVVW